MKKEALKTVIVLSGGMDSSTLAYYLKDKGHKLTALTFNYGQKHNREAEHAEKIAKKLGIPWKLVDISDVKKILSSSLTDDKQKVPHGHYAAKNMKSTVVPNRNAIMLSIAGGYAGSIKARYIGYAAHGGDHFIYADCRPLFVNCFSSALAAAFIDEKIRPELIAPFINIDKTDIVRMGHMLKVPYGETWSCYEGGEKHCGKCGTCVERKEAFQKSGVSDPTEYK